MKKGVGGSADTPGLFEKICVCWRVRQPPTVSSRAYCQGGSPPPVDKYFLLINTAKTLTITCQEIFLLARYLQITCGTITWMSRMITCALLALCSRSPRRARQPDGWRARGGVRSGGGARPPVSLMAGRRSRGGQWRGQLTGRVVAHEVRRLTIWRPRGAAPDDLAPTRCGA